MKVSGGFVVNTDFKLKTGVRHTLTSDDAMKIAVKLAEHRKRKDSLKKIPDDQWVQLSNVLALAFTEVIGESFKPVPFLLRLGAVAEK